MGPAAVSGLSHPCPLSTSSDQCLSVAIYSLMLARLKETAVVRGQGGSTACTQLTAQWEEARHEINEQHTECLDCDGEQRGFYPGIKEGCAEVVPAE